MVLRAVSCWRKLKSGKELLLIRCGDEVVNMKSGDPQIKSKEELMGELRTNVKSCELCKNITNIRKQFGFGKLPGCGSLEPKLMFLTIAPSWTNPTIKPNYVGEQAAFVSRAFYLWYLLAEAKLLDSKDVENIESEGEISVRASRLNRFLVEKGIYITCTLKCPKFGTNPKTGKLRNREPAWNEVLNCLRWLEKEIRLLEPKIICTLGEIPFKALLEDSKSKPEWCEPYTYEKHITIFPCHYPKRFEQDRQISLGEFKQLKNLIESYY
ncbi:MAG: uracil-DNA glycosylase family protein [Candidatus Jordarchaeaceae archaeon]